MFPPGLLSFYHTGLPMALCSDAPNSNSMPITDSPKRGLESTFQIDNHCLGGSKR